MSEVQLSKAYYRIGEVSKIVGVQPHVLRYWESEFRAIRPQKSGKGQRVYSKSDVSKLLCVKDLLRNQGFTIAGARRQLLSSRLSEPVVAPRADARALSNASLGTESTAPAKGASTLSLAGTRSVGGLAAGGRSPLRQEAVNLRQLCSTGLDYGQCISQVESAEEVTSEGSQRQARTMRRALLHMRQEMLAALDELSPSSGE